MNVLSSCQNLLAFFYLQSIITKMLNIGMKEDVGL